MYCFHSGIVQTLGAHCEWRSVMADAGTEESVAGSVSSWLNVKVESRFAFEVAK